jgi:hypothetical protein
MTVWFCDLCQTVCNGEVDPLLTYFKEEIIDMYMSKAAFISNDHGNLASFTALYVMSQRGNFPLLIRYVNTCGRGMRKGWWGEPSINVID